MIIYTVKPGDSPYSIARQFGVNPDRVIYDNQIENPKQLVIGRALVIDTDDIKHRVAQGETVFGLSRRYSVPIEEIFGANPILNSRSRIFPGQIITIPQRSGATRDIDVNGFTVRPSAAALAETLPSLTYISPFSYQIDSLGNLSALDDKSVNSAARAEHTAPMMCITNIESGGGFSSDVAHYVLTDEQAQNNLVTNITRVLMREKYHGLIVDIEYVYPYDRESFNQFLRRIAEVLHALGFILATAVAPKTSDDQPGTLYEAHDYRVHGEAADFVIIMTYEWGYLYGPAMAVAPIDPVRRVLDYATGVIPPHKIMMGMPNYGYDWTLPFVQGTAAKSLSNLAAINLAADVGAHIMYDEKQQAPYFNYYDAQGRRHEVWFDDARSINARLQLVNDYGLAGINYWTIDKVFRQQYLVLQSMYGIKKII